MRRRNFLLAPLALAVRRISADAPRKHRGFEDAARKAGLKFTHAASRTSQKYLPETMGSGVALFDYNNDGLLDVFFANGAALGDPMSPEQQPDKSDPRYWNRLFRNNGDGTFTDMTEAAGLRGKGYSMGVAVGDFNNDGWPDLFVTGFGSNTLYLNRGDGTFQDVTDKAGVRGGGWSASACFLDYDLDGRLDLCVTRYLDWSFSRNPYCGDPRPGRRSYCHPDKFGPATHLLYRNNGDGTFTDVSKASGLAAVPGKGLGIAINDFDRDGWPDISIANDSWPQQLFRNNRNGTFTEVAADLGLAYDEDGRTFAGMGIDFADYDNDGWPDVFIDALANQRYALYRNHSGAAFDYVSGSVGLSGSTRRHSGWGAKFFDYDNDGWKDLFVAQGHVLDNVELTDSSMRYREPPLLLRNSNGRFENMSRESGAIFQSPLAARGAAFGDLDNDGSIDIAISCNDGPAILLLNRGGNGNRWLIVNTIGTRSNRDGIGARIRIVGESGAEQHGFVSTSGSYLSASDKRVHFGLGSDKTVSVEVTWPSGTVQRIENVAADRVLNVTEPRATAP